MKIHEYQAKQLLKKYNIPIQDGLVAEKKDEINNIIKSVQKTFNSEDVIVKAQIHAGGRGKGGGIKYCQGYDDAVIHSNNILGMQLITKQTGSNGKEVKKIMITEALDISKEYYIALTLDRKKKQIVIMASSEGGMDIEEVAEKTPEKIKKIWVDPVEGIQDNQILDLISILDLETNLINDCKDIISNLYKCYWETDASLIEINPLVLTEQNKLVAIDAKFNFDSNALYRHEEIHAMEDPDEVDPYELEASKYSLNYIKLDGNVGCMVNGAGLAMATMDIIKSFGGEPANFLDVGGAASVDTVKNGFKIILQDKNVKSILINIFGGIVRCDRVANGVVQAVSELDLNVPVIVRLEGTNAIIAKDILDESGLAIISANSMEDAAQKCVEAL
jgi:succinyl-CoA synthetase beta subunit